ncbi:MAG: MBL fold metallo-hydrolase [Dysgonomonas sp.]|nr:MBL fold metallo-hydrolase [Dysgonomonas sp.]
MQYELFGPHHKYKLISLSSGSNGNCYYLGTSQYGILIDVGIGARTLMKYLREYGIAIETIAGILITHDHADHIKSVGALGCKLNIPVYATETVLAGIERSPYVRGKALSLKKVIEKEQTFEIRNFSITAFEVPHDTIENVGYQICIEDKTIVLVTDIGRITDTILRFARNANHLIVEANYDEEMLRNGRYPYYLKQRIVSGMGHLSNRLTGELLCSVYHSDMEEVWLCHLSQDNNHPEIAYKTVQSALESKGIKVGKDVLLKTLNRGKPSGMKQF